MATVQLDNVNKVYENGFHAIHDLSLDIVDGEFLVLVGPSGWHLGGHGGLRDMVNAAGLEGYVHYLGYVPTSDLPGLLSLATVFAFPSLYEGFGLPVLEAMGCGCPVICSNASSLPEVAGDAAVLFDPRDGGRLALELSRVLASPALRDELRARGVARAREFSWDRTAIETVAVYRRLAG